MQVDLIGHLLGDLDQEPAVDVDRALRPAGGAARVGDEQRVLGVKGTRVEGGGVRGEELVPPDVAPGGPGHVRQSQA